MRCRQRAVPLSWDTLYMQRRDEMSTKRCALVMGYLFAALFITSRMGGFVDAQPSTGIRPEICATVTLLEGASTVALPPQGQRPLRAGETLPAGSILQTDGNSKVELTLADSSIARVAGDSSIELAIDTRSGEKQARQFQLKLLKGEIWVTLPNLPEGDNPPQVLVANALLVGKESAFRAILSRDGAAEIKVYSGYVTASGPFVFVKEASRFLLHLAEEDGMQNTEPWRYRIEPYRKIIIQALGQETKPFRFTARADLSEWVRWNQSRDAEKK